METIFKKVSIEDRLPEKNKFVTTIDEAGEHRVYRLTEHGWNMRDSDGTNSPNNNLKITHWLEEVEDSGFKIDFFELAFLAQICIPPVPIARHMFFDNLTSVYYNRMTVSERARLYEWMYPKLDYNNDSCIIFEARFNPNNQYLVKYKFNGEENENECFKLNDRYYITRNTWIDSKFIIEVKQHHIKHK